MRKTLIINLDNIPDPDRPAWVPGWIDELVALSDEEWKEIDKLQADTVSIGRAVVAWQVENGNNEAYKLLTKGVKHES